MGGYQRQGLFGYPTVVVIGREEAKTKEGIYGAVIKSLERWTKNAKDLYSWEAAPDGESFNKKSHQW